MKLILKTVFLASLLFPGVAKAQSWQSSGDRATAPRAIAGDPSGGFEIVCFQGEWSLYLFTAISPETETSPASIIVDGQTFQTRLGLLGSHGDQGIVMTMPIIDALKSGSRVEITFPTGGTPYRATFSLKGSSRALKAAEAGCAYPTPTTAPDRFKTITNGSTSEAITLASRLLRPILDEAQKGDPQVGIEGAGIVDLGNGWQFLISDIGPSTSLYGVAGFATVVAAKPPSGEWHIVDGKTGVATYVDRQHATNGYPDIVYQSVRGVNPPFGFWVWDGTKYVHSRNITP